MRLIDADALKRELYHVAFETDTPLQKWDSGCWLRYKLVEICINKAPTVNAVEVKDIEAEVKNLKLNLASLYGKCVTDAEEI